MREAMGVVPTSKFRSARLTLPMGVQGSKHKNELVRTQLNICDWCTCRTILGIFEIKIIKYESAHRNGV
jgi:hypothetical protein